jgi:serine/threonine protein kinase
LFKKNNENFVFIFSAPEVLNYDTLGLYTDMWSLGVLTYVMLTTCSPFAAEDKQMTFSNITSVNLDFPEDLFGDISQAAQDFIQKLLIADPRYVFISSKLN